MFLEPKADNGRIEVITGSMFSGKTEELLRRIKRAKIAGQKCVLYKPIVDNRYHKTAVVSHDKNTLESIAVKNPEEIFNWIDGIDIIGIDEAQFFNGALVEVVRRLANMGKRIIVAGLDMDYMGKPFAPMPEIMAIAEYVSKTNAICVVCGKLASHSFRTAKSDKQVSLGAENAYEARCRKCFNKGMSNQANLF